MPLKYSESWVETDEKSHRVVVIKLKARGIKGLVDVEMSPANMSRLFDIPESTARRGMEEEGRLRRMREREALDLPTIVEVTLEDAGISTEIPLAELAHILDVSESAALKIMNNDESAISEWHARNTPEDLHAMLKEFMDRKWQKSEPEKVSTAAMPEPPEPDLPGKTPMAGSMAATRSCIYCGTDALSIRDGEYYCSSCRRYLPSLGHADR